MKRYKATILAIVPYVFHFYSTNNLKIKIFLVGLFGPTIFFGVKRVKFGVKRVKFGVKRVKFGVKFGVKFLLGFFGVLTPFKGVE